MIINKLPISKNFSYKFNKMKFIVVHDTGNSSSGADALAHYRYFDSAYRGASAHFFVDAHNVVELVDPHLVAWHCGDGKGKKGIFNNNSIGIEICINPESDFEMAKAQTLELIRFLMASYGISKTNVRRHFDASGKVCPRSMCENNWQEWWDFWNKI